MLQKNWKIYLVGVLIPLMTGSISGLLSMGSMDIYGETVMKPPLAPPGWLFPVVWTALYVLMGISSTLIWLSPASAGRHQGLNLYVAQLMVNFFWSLIFFNARAFGFAALWLALLWVLVLLMILKFRRVNAFAAKLQIPYMIWLSFAGYLNIAIWMLNR